MSSLLDAYGVRLPQHGWVVLDALRAHGFTGAVVLTGSPPTRVYLDRGRVYAGEPLGLAPLGPRLVAAGVLSPDQYARGVVRLDGHDRLSALFGRAPSVDRHAVLAALSAMTDAAVKAVAQQVIAHVECEPYAFHPAGVHEWFETAAAPTLVVPAVPSLDLPAAPSPDQVAAPSPVPGPVPTPEPPAAPSPTADSGAAVAEPVVSAPPVSGAAPAASAPGAHPASASPSAAAEPVVRWDESPYVHEVSAGLIHTQPTEYAPGPAAAGPARLEWADEQFAVIWPGGDVERRAADPPTGAQPFPGPVAEPDVAGFGALLDQAGDAGDDLAVRRAVAMIDTGQLAARQRLADTRFES